MVSSRWLRPPNAQFLITDDHESTRPRFHRFSSKDLAHTLDEPAPAGIAQTDEHDSCMGTWPEHPHIREVKVLSQKQAVLFLGHREDGFIRPTDQ